METQIVEIDTEIQVDEITSLNIENLDVEELERRLELSGPNEPDPVVCWVQLTIPF